jgi:ADP-heptose:LPS heptosyltransferase
VKQNPNELALELVNHCLRGNSWPRDLLQALLSSALSSNPEVAAHGSRALFGIVVERLADLFEPALCDTYARLFSEVIERAEGLDAAALVDRYQRIRQPRRFEGPDPARAYVLSRVTLGADIAVTSVVLDALKRRFPAAEILLAGPRKSYELFEADPRIGHLPVDYGRSSALRDRLAIWPELQRVLDRPDAIVVDPDSRLTQLGLLPVCAEERYFFFESRGWGGYEHDPLGVITSEWLASTFGVSGSTPFLAPRPSPLESAGTITVSLGVGENQAKRLPDPFETELLRLLASTGRPILVDKGMGGEELTRVERAVALSGIGSGQVRYWHGSFAPFASAVMRSALYAGYDSAGQHVAAAAGVPLMTIFAGFASDRMFARWQPSGPGRKAVIPVRFPDPAGVLDEAAAALRKLLAPID